MDIKSRLAHPVCQRFFELFKLEREIEAMMNSRRGELRHEFNKAFGEISKDERLAVLRQEIKNYRDEEFAAAFGVSVNTIWENRSRAGIKRSLHKKMTPEQLLVVKAFPENEMKIVAEKLGLGLSHLKQIKRTQRKARW